MSAAERRRELNRLAAQRLRSKRKDRANHVRSEYFAAQSVNTRLMYELKQLSKEKEKLQTRLTTHLQTCNRKLQAYSALTTCHSAVDSSQASIAKVSNSLQQTIKLQGVVVNHLASNFNGKKAVNPVLCRSISETDITSHWTESRSHESLKKSVSVFLNDNELCNISPNDSIELALQTIESYSASSLEPDSGCTAENVALQRNSSADNLHTFQRGLNVDESCHQNSGSSSQMLPLTVIAINERCTGDWC